jgi:hypothetical protein
MNANDIVKEAKARLVEIETEAVKLRAIIEAVEGKKVQPLPVPNPLPFIPVMPQPMPYFPNVVREYPWDPLGPVICHEIPQESIRGFVAFVAGGTCANLGDVVFKA